MRAGRIDVPPNVRVHSVGKEHSYSQARRALEFYRVLIQLLRTRRYGACLAHMIPVFAVMSAPLLKAQRIPIVLWHSHRSTPPTLRIAERLVDKVISSSPQGFPLQSRKLTITGYGIDTHLFRPSAESYSRQTRFVVVSVGRIAPVKRLDVLLDAVSLLIDRYRIADLEVRLVGPVMSGDRRYADSLSRKAKALGKDVVKFTGPASPVEVARQYQRADVMVNVSDLGSPDKAVFEAMSCGLPVVVANRAFADLLEDMEPALLVPTGDPDAIALACKQVHDLSDSERAILGKQLRMLAIENHELDRLVGRLVNEVLFAK
jgi:glycosyltransferase involved in cell wall biosynthesis